MKTFSVQQQNILASSSVKLTWLFEVGSTYKWSTKLYRRTLGSTATYTAKVLPSSFKGITLNSSKMGNSVITASDTSFTVSNPSNTLSESDFKTSGVFDVVKVSLIVGATLSTYTEDLFGTWSFNIKEVVDLEQKLTFQIEDYLKKFLEGQWPNKPFISTLSPSEIDTTDDFVVPVVFGIGYIPVRGINDGGSVYYVLGEHHSGTYDIHRLLSPAEWGNSQSTYATGYTFTQSIGTYGGIQYRLVQPLINRPEGSSATYVGAYPNGSGGLYDPFCKYASDGSLATKTNPSSVAKFLLKEFGVSASMVSTASFTSLKSTLTAQSLSFNKGFYIPEDNDSVLGDVLRGSNARLESADKVEIDYLSKTSVATFTSADIVRTKEDGNTTFKKTSNNANKGNYDSGYIEYRTQSKPQTDLVKVKIGVADSSLGTTTNDTISFPYYRDLDSATKAGQMVFERDFFVDKKCNFTAHIKHINKRPDDVITINNSNYGGTYSAIIESINIPLIGTPKITVSTLTHALTSFASAGTVSNPLGSSSIGTVFTDDGAQALISAASAASMASAALAASSSAGVRTYLQDSAPATSLATTGDLWFDSNDGNKLYRYNDSTSSWASVQDTDIAFAIAAADGKIVTYYQTSSPATATSGDGDIWFDTNDGNKTYRYSDSLSTWVNVQDSEIATAINNAATAQSTADGKIVTYYQASSPATTTAGDGDLWIDTDDEGLIFRYDDSSGSWVTAYNADVTPNYPFDDNLFGYWTGDGGLGSVAYDSSGNGNHGTLMSNATWATGVAGSCFEFDGTDSYVDLGNQGVTGSKTLSAWIYVDEASYQAKDYYIISDRIVPDDGFVVTLNGINSLIYFTQYDGSAHPVNSGTTTVPLKTWTHVAAVFDGVNGHIYINGVLCNSAAFNDNDASASPLTIGVNGDNPTSATNFKGRIDEVRIYKRVLTANEIKSLYLWPIQTKSVQAWEAVVGDNRPADNADVTDTAINSGTLITAAAGGLELQGGGRIFSNGKSSYASVGPGFFIGWDADKHKINIGDGTSFWKWNGSYVDSTLTNLKFTRLAKPTSAPTGVEGSAGSLATATYNYQVTYITVEGETEAGTTSGNVVLTTKSRVNLSNIPTSPSDKVIARGIYRNSDGGFRKCGELAGNTLATFTDNMTVEDLYAQSRIWVNSTGGGISLDGTQIMHFGTTNNILIGPNAGYNNIYYTNIHIGNGAGQYSITGQNSIFIGNSAGNYCTTGYYNVGIGDSSLRNVGSGRGNIGIGIWAGYSIDGNDNNICIGEGAGQISYGEDNIYIGTRAGTNASASGENVCIGYEAGYGVNDTGRNTFIGYQAGRGVSSDRFNHYCTAIGYQAGTYATGYGNILLGYQAGFNNLGNRNYKLEISSAGNKLITGDMYNSWATIHGDCHIDGALSKNSGTFKIDHPTKEDKTLYHGFVEAPRYDLIYRGVVHLKNGSAEINIDKESNMSEGTFDALCQNTVVHSLNNLDGFNRVRSLEIRDGKFIILCEDKQSEDRIAWLVVGERKDKHIKGINLTNDEGVLKPEHEKYEQGGFLS